MLLAWQLNGEWQFDPALVTELEIRFTSQGAAETRVELEHRNLERLGDHADRARTAFNGEGGWAGLLAAYADIAAR